MAEEKKAEEKGVDSVSVRVSSRVSARGEGTIGDV